MGGQKVRVKNALLSAKLKEKIVETLIEYDSIEVFLSCY